MVSLRRRRLLGLCSGKNSFIAPLPRFWDSQTAFGNHNTKSVSVHPLPSDGINLLKDRSSARTGFGSLSLSGSTSSKEQNVQPHSAQPVKRRKRHRRKLIQNQEPCVMRGVYFKNMKWQAAIKVDKKQIHLGTVGSQEEAAHLYDRAAFMCGREPNFELPEEEKEELCNFSWDQFLAFTRRSITNKKQKRKVGGAPEKTSRPAEAEESSGEWEQKHRMNELSVSDDAELDSSES